MWYKSKAKFNEKWPRNLIKVISWRATVTMSNFLGVWWVSGGLTAGLGFAGFALVVNRVLYFFHELAWNRVDWAKQVLTTSECPSV
jgi:uncharacterized membrane protein